MLKSILFSLLLALLGLAISALGWRTVSLNCDKVGNVVNCMVHEQFFNGLYVRKATANNVLDAKTAKSRVNHTKFKNHRKSIYTTSLVTDEEVIPLTIISTSDKDDSFASDLVKEADGFIQDATKTSLQIVTDYYSKILALVGGIMAMIGLSGILRSFLKPK